MRGREVWRTWWEFPDPEMEGDGGSICVLYRVWSRAIAQLPLRASPGNAKALGLLIALSGSFKDVKHCLFVQLPM